MSMNHPSYSSSYPQRLRECERHGPWPCIILNLVHPRPSLSSLAATNHSLNLTSLLSFFPSILCYLSKPYAFAFSSSFSSSCTSISTTSPHRSQSLSSSTSSSLPSSAPLVIYPHTLLDISFYTAVSRPGLDHNHFWSFAFH